MYRTTFDSPLGQLQIDEFEGAITRLSIGEFAAGELDETPILQEARAQIMAYFEGRKTCFDLPLAPAATEFQQRMRDFMLAIPSGHTRSYGEAAKCLASAPRAVGQACARNPIPIIVPCHRIVAAAGRIGGFSGGKGLPTKRLLLALEAETNIRKVPT